MKRILAILLLTIGLTVLARSQTDRFTIGKIATHFLTHPCPTLDPHLLTQDYSYLGKGGQSYVFVSEDGQYVLKLFRGSRLHTSSLLGLKKRAEEHKNELERALESYLLAFVELREETGLVGLHLDTHTQLEGTLSIIDKIQIRHTMDPNSVPFVIQKRATPMKDVIANTPKKELFESLFALLRKRQGVGIYDPDANLLKNFGFIGRQAIQIDPGRFTKDPKGAEKLKSSAMDLQQLLRTHHPTVAEQFQTLYEEYTREAI